MTNNLLLDAEPIGRQLILENLKKLGVRILTESKIIRIGDHSVTCQDSNGTDYTLEADFIVVALGARSENSIKSSLENKGFDLFTIGDCVRPRDLMTAIHEGAEIARRL
jgi:NADH dehydrogenase FAD-containing subunit